MKLVAAVVLIVIIGILTAVSIPMMEPNNKDECVLANIENAHSDLAARIIRATCDNLYPPNFDDAVNPFDAFDE